MATPERYREPTTAARPERDEPNDVARATLDAVELHCRRHCHSGVNPGAHEAYLAVLQIIEAGRILS